MTETRYLISRWQTQTEMFYLGNSFRFLVNTHISLDRRVCECNPATCVERAGLSHPPAWASIQRFRPTRSRRDSTYWSSGSHATYHWPRNWVSQLSHDATRAMRQISRFAEWCDFIIIPLISDLTCSICWVTVDREMTCHWWPCRAIEAHAHMLTEEMLIEL